MMLPYNAICPDCSARYISVGGPTNGYINLVRCQDCQRTNRVRDAAATGRQMAWPKKRKAVVL